MISYDDIVKAGSNIGGWEGKRGFYAVERYYEMAEKLRVQGYEKMQAGDDRNALIMLLKFAKLFEEIQKQPKLDKSSAGFKKVGRDMLKAMGEMEALKLIAAVVATRRRRSNVRSNKVAPLDAA